ncbi:MAG TPA: hypothetical protein EYO96_05315 [Candidatus Marinimicrobia bacterium]|nr:hypothetical protein [Candidatus Neomarinimicrobiota bacterium]
MTISRRNTAKQLTGSRSKKAKRKVKIVMKEFKKGTLRSGSKEGKKVTSRKRAIAIALSEGRRASRTA